METIAGSGSYSFSRKPFFLAKVIYFNGIHCQQWKSLLLVEVIFSMEAICFIRSYSFQWKMLFLVETIPFSGSHYIQWKPLACSSIHSIQQKLLLLMQGISFIGSYSFYWKLSILVNTIPVSGTHFRQWKPFLSGKAFVFHGNHCPIFLVEAAPFNQNFSFQWKPFFLVLQNFRQENLSPVT